MEGLVVEAATVKPAEATVAAATAVAAMVVEEGDPGAAAIGSPRRVSSVRAWTAHRRCQETGTGSGRPRAWSLDLAREWVPPEATGPSRSRVLQCKSKNVRWAMKD